MPASLILPALVFAAELTVVTLSTVRIICLGRGQKVIASAIGFFEVSIWLFAIGQVMRNLSDVTCSAAFAGGFTLGNFLGVLIEGKLAMGNAVVRIITPKDAGELVTALRAAGYGVTAVDARGATGPVQIVLTVVPRRDLGRVVALAKGFDPKVFYSVDELKEAVEGVAPRRLRGLFAGLPVSEAPALVRGAAAKPKGQSRPAARRVRA